MTQPHQRVWTIYACPECAHFQDTLGQCPHSHSWGPGLTPILEPVEVVVAASRDTLERGGEALAVAARLRLSSDEALELGPFDEDLANGLRAWNEAREALRPDTTPTDGASHA